MKKRVCELQINDIFVKYGARYAITDRVKNYFIYQAVNEKNETISGAVPGCLGMKSQEWVIVEGKAKRIDRYNIERITQRLGIDGK